MNALAPIQTSTFEDFLSSPMGSLVDTPQAAEVSVVQTAFESSSAEEAEVKHYLTALLTYMKQVLDSSVKIAGNNALLAQNQTLVGKLSVDLAEITQKNVQAQLARVQTKKPWYAILFKVLLVFVAVVIMFVAIKTKNVGLFMFGLSLMITATTKADAVLDSALDNLMAKMGGPKWLQTAMKVLIKLVIDIVITGGASALAKAALKQVGKTALKTAARAAAKEAVMAGAKEAAVASAKILTKEASEAGLQIASKEAAKMAAKEALESGAGMAVRESAERAAMAAAKEAAKRSGKEGLELSAEKVSKIAAEAMENAFEKAFTKAFVKTVVKGGADDGAAAAARVGADAASNESAKTVSKNALIQGIKDTKGYIAMNFVVWGGVRDMFRDVENETAKMVLDIITSILIMLAGGFLAAGGKSAAASLSREAQLGLAAFSTAAGATQGALGIVQGFSMLQQADVRKKLADALRDMVIAQHLVDQNNTSFRASTDAGSKALKSYSSMNNRWDEYAETYRVAAEVMA